MKNTFSLLVCLTGLPCAAAATDFRMSRMASNENLTWVTENTTVRSDEQGRPLVINTRSFLVCKGCNAEYKQGVCSCSHETLPLLTSALPRAAQASLEDSREPKTPNRFMQAIAACFSFPQALCFACKVCCDTETKDLVFNPNSCHEEYVQPFDLPEEYAENCCCVSTLLFCPCCAPQVEAE